MAAEPAPAPAPEDAPATALEAQSTTETEPAPDAATEAVVAEAPEEAEASPAATAPAPEPATEVAELPEAPEATVPAAEVTPEAPVLAETATPPEAPAALEPPAAEANAAPDAAAEAPPVIAEAAEPAPAPAVEPAPEVELAEAAPEPTPVPEVAPVEAAPETAPAATEAQVVPQPGLPADEPLPQVEGMTPDTDEPILPEEGGEPEAGEMAEAADPDAATSTFKPAPSLGDSTEGVIVGRLPRIGDAPVEEAPEAGATAEAEVAPEAAPAEAEPPIKAFAATFENPDQKPVLALVLIDPGTADLDRAGLAGLPFPVSFALDPMDPATPERAAIYRGAGKEVVMLATGIAEGAQPSDIEVAFQSMAQGLPEAVAVMDLAEPQFQDRRPVASLVVPVIGAQGRGLLTWDRGLNAADQVARRDDVPAAVLFRDLDEAAGDSTAIRRVLDRAVFKAGQDGRAAVAGTATPEVVAALLEWTVEGKAATVALGPVTAVMTVE